MNQTHGHHLCMYIVHIMHINRGKLLLVFITRRYCKAIHSGRWKWNLPLNWNVGKKKQTQMTQMMFTNIFPTNSYSINWNIVCMWWSTDLKCMLYLKKCCGSFARDTFTYQTLFFHSIEFCRAFRFACAKIDQFFRSH